MYFGSNSSIRASKSGISSVFFDNTPKITGPVPRLIFFVYSKRVISSFGPKTFLEKKMSYFNTSEKFKSRHLLHTVSVFANSQWTESNITENKQSIIKQLNNYYELN